MSKGNFKFAVMVLSNGMNGGGNVFLDKLVDYRLRPSLVVSHDPFFFPKKSLLTPIRFIKRYLKQVIQRDEFRRLYYPYCRAHQLGIPTFPAQIVNTERCAERLRNLNLDYIFVFTFQILKDYIFSIPRYGTINFHPALLPGHRGATPLFWSLRDGEDVAGFTFHYVDKGIDTGRIIRQFKVPLSGLEDSDSLIAHLYRLGADELVRMIHELRLGIQPDCIIEEGVQDSYEKFARKKDRIIGPDMKAEEVIRLVRASRYVGCALLKVGDSTVQVMDAIPLRALPDVFEGKGRAILDEERNIYYSANDGIPMYLITKG